MSNGKWYIVCQGDSIESIAFQNGHFWLKLWNDPENAELVKKRKTPHVLAPGDRVFIPEIREKEIAIHTDQRYCFQRRGVPSRINLLLNSDGKVCNNEPYVLEIDGQRFEGRTDANGRIQHWIAPNAKLARLRIGEGFATHYVELALRHLDPLTTVSGLQARLCNLGFNPGNVDGSFGPRTHTALKRFQEAYGLPVTGEVDDGTLAKLEEIYTH